MRLHFYGKLHNNNEFLVFIPDKDGIFDQQPVTSIQYHVAIYWNHEILSKLDINFKILAYVDS